MYKYLSRTNIKLQYKCINKPVGPSLLTSNWRAENKKVFVC